MLTVINQGFDIKMCRLIVDSGAFAQAVDSGLNSCADDRDTGGTELFQFARFERAGRPIGSDTGLEQRLGSIDVAEAGDYLLIHYQRLDATCALGAGGFQVSRSQFADEGFDNFCGWQIGDFDQAEAARIAESKRAS